MPLFDSNEREPDLQPAEREAIIDLLHLCTYADARIALKEDDVVSQALLVLGWDQSTSWREYEPKSIERARDARASERALDAFLRDAAQRLQSPRARRCALEFCSRLFAADGLVAESERALLERIKAVLA